MASEKDLEQALMDRLQATLLELGHGIAFVGRQVRFDVDGDELVIDLLLFHLEQLRYIVVELKIGRFQPADAGQLGTYVALVDDRLRRPDRHAPTIGLLLVTGRNEQIVRYALSSANAPMAVATYTTDTLPAEARSALPPPEELRAALDLSTLRPAKPSGALVTSATPTSASLPHRVALPDSDDCDDLCTAAAALSTGTEHPVADAADAADAATLLTRPGMMNRVGSETIV